MEGQARCECPPRYLSTIPGILKIVEMVFTILTFAISFGGQWSYRGGGWVEFTGISCFITVTIWFILHLINLVPQIFLNYLFELISYCVMTVILFISGIVAAAQAGNFGYPLRSSIGAASFFAFASAIACAVDAVLQFLEYRQGTSHTSATTTTVTTTTTSSSAVKAEY